VSSSLAGWFGIVVIGHINKVKLHRDWRRPLADLPSNSTIYPGQFSLAIPPWVDAVSTGDGFGHPWGRNGEFCILVRPATSTVGILAEID